MFRKLVLVLLALPLVYFGARWIVRSFESDEERIQRAVAEMVEGFNEAQGRPVLDAQQVEDVVAFLRTLR